MSKVNKLSLKKNFSWNFIGSLIYSLSQFLILVILAKLGNPAMVGLYSIGLAITEPINKLTNLQLRQIQATDTKDSNYKFNDYYGLRIVSSTIMVLIILVIIIISSYRTEKSLIILLIVLRRMIFSYSDVVFGQLQKHERMDYIGKSQSVRGISSIVVVAITLYFTGNLIITLIMLNLLWFFLFVFYDRKNLTLFISNVKPYFSISKFRSLFILALPLGIVLMLISLNTNVPRIFVERILGEAALGYFASIAYLIVAGNIFVSAVGQAVAPRLAKLYSDGEINKFKRILNYMLIISILIGLIGVFLSIYMGEFVLTLLYDETYAEHNQVLVLIMISGIFSFSRAFMGYGLTSMRYFKVQPYINLLGLIIILISSSILIPIYNLNGAAIALILGSAIQCLLYYIVIHHQISKL